MRYGVRLASCLLVVAAGCVDLTRPLDVDAGAIESPDDADTPDDGGMPPLDAPADQQVSPEAGVGDGASDRPTSDARDAPVRFGLDFLRATDYGSHPDQRYAGLTPAQWACLATLLLGARLMGLIRARPRPAS